MKEQIHKLINELPPLSESAKNINEALNDPVQGFSLLVKTIEKDPLLTTLILNAVNSPLYGFNNKINDIRRAIILLGVNTVSGMALNILIKNMFKIDLSPYGINETKFMDLSLSYSALSKTICKGDNISLYKIVGPIAFLLEIGKIITSQIIINNNLSIQFQEALKSDKRICEIEKELLGFNSYEATALILEHFNFDKDLILIKI